MGKMIIKRIQPTMVNKRLYNNGRQSSMKSIFKDKEYHNDNAVVKEAEPIKDIVMEQKKEDVDTTVKENKQEVKEQTKTVMMDTNEKIAIANAILADDSKIKAKRIRKEKGLIERAEKPIILTEDNKELLID